MRIILRCFLVIAFSGVLSCYAQNLSTIPDVSEFSKPNELNSKSTPENSSIKVNESFTTVEKSENELNSTPEENRSKSETQTNATETTPHTSYSTENDVSVEETTEENHEFEENSTIFINTSLKNQPNSVTHENEEVSKDALTNDVINTTSIDLTSVSTSRQSNDSALSKNSDHAQVKKSEFIDSEAKLFDEGNSKNEFASSSVPSAEELIYKISTVEDCNCIPSSKLEAFMSTVSSAHKRSLSSTISDDDDIIVAIEDEFTTHQPDYFSNTPTQSFLADTESLKNGDVDHGRDEIHSQEDASFSSNLSESSDSNRRNENVSITEDIKNVPVSPLEVEHLSSMSSVALSTPNDESIHLSESSSKTDTSLPLNRSISVSPYESELEVENNTSTRSLNSFENEESLVTFDPNGMTNNFTQDPDSVTFIPKFQVDGKKADRYLSRLETDHNQQNKSDIEDKEINLLENAEHISGVSPNTESELFNDSEREREFISGGNLVHDLEKEKSSANISISDAKERVVTKSGESPLSVDNEREEMLNDAPAFVIAKSTNSPLKEEKVTAQGYTISNIKDIDTTALGSSSNIITTVKELENLVVFHTEQSEIRPVTVASPIQTPESTPPKVDNLTSSYTITSDHPKSTVPHTSSPIIQPNPAPTDPNVSSLSDIETANVIQNKMTKAEFQEVTVAGNVDGFSILNSTDADVINETSVPKLLPISNNSLTVTENQTADFINATLESASSVLNNGADVKFSTVESASAVPTTTSRGLRIRKPKIKIGGIDAPETGSTRKPFLKPPPKPATTEGPPVSIFGKSKTRASSITSSTTERPFPQFSTVRVHYASRFPGIVPQGELVFSVETTSTTAATTTETEEPFSIEPFTDVTQLPVVTNEDDVTLVKVAGFIVVDKGLRWHEQLDNRHSPQYKEKANFVHLQLERLFRTSSIAPHLWKIQIDGFSGKRNSRAVAVDFFIYLIKSKHEIPAENLTTVFHEKLTNNTFSRFRVDPTQTAFEFVTEEPLKAPTPSPENLEEEPVIPQWAIAVIVVGAASLIFVVLFATVAVLGRRHMRRRYSNKLNDEDSDRPSEWESKMAAAYENLAADTIYDAEDLHSDTYKKRMRPNSTYQGRPSSMLNHATPRRADSWSSSDWSPPPRRPRPQVHRIVY